MKDLKALMVGLFVCVMVAPIVVFAQTGPPKDNLIKVDFSVGQWEGPTLMKEDKVIYLPTQENWTKQIYKAVPISEKRTPQPPIAQPDKVETVRGDAIYVVKEIGDVIPEKRQQDVWVKVTQDEKKTTETKTESFWRYRTIR